MATQDLGSVFSGIEPGDEVAVEWGRRKHQRKDDLPEDHYVYGASGTVLQVTKRVVIVRHCLGYTFSVSAADVISGTKIKVVKRKEEEPMDGLNEGTDAAGLRPGDGTAAAEPGAGVVEETTGGEVKDKEAELLTVATAGEAAPVEEVEKLEFTKENVERLIAEGVSKAEMCRKFGVSFGKFYYNLAKWGLHEPQKGVGRGSRQGSTLLSRAAPRQTGARPGSKEGVKLAIGSKEGVKLAIALELKKQAEFELNSIQRVLHEARGLGVQVADVVIQDLVEIENKYAGRLQKIEAALEKVRVVI